MLKCSNCVIIATIKSQTTIKNNHTQQREPVGKNIQFLGNKYCLRIKIKVHKLNKPFWQ